jgi:hypothetical protein
MTGSSQPKDWFKVAHLNVDFLLANWRWLVKVPMSLVAKNASGDLFLRDKDGLIFWLDVSFAEVTNVADCETEFLLQAAMPENRERWFERPEALASERGLLLGPDQCVAFSIPRVFKEGGKPGMEFVVDLYECVAFLGDIHGQIAELPNGTVIELNVGKLSKTDLQ